MKKVLSSLAACALAGSLVAVSSATGASGGGGKASPANPWGITVVRFAKGTTPAQMRDAIAAAGGDVANDLSKIGAMSAVPLSSGFATKIRANKLVTAAWVDRTVSAIDPDATTDTTVSGLSGNGTPQLGAPGPNTPPDPWHDLRQDPSVYLNPTNPDDIVQWDDYRMNVVNAWKTTTGDPSIKVAVIDTGVQGSHKELHENYDGTDSENAIPCSTLTRDFGQGVASLGDCSSEDTYGHGTWVAGRIAGAANGFASNGIAPHVRVAGFKALSTKLGFGLTSWIVQAMLDACSENFDVINMSLGGYDDLSPEGQADYLLWLDAVNYCRSQGTTIFASAGNEHVRVNRVTMTIGGQRLSGVGQVDTGNEGIASVLPGDVLANYDLRGLLETPAGVPGVIMVSATNNSIAPADPRQNPAVAWPSQFWGKADQLTYYSSYGSRVDISAPGGARKYNIPRVDGGPGDVLVGGWGTLGPVDASGDLCTVTGSLSTFACFVVSGAGFGWLQGTSMSSPNAAGVGALVLSAHPELRGKPDALLARLQSTARKDMVNYMGPNDPANTAPDFFGNPCPTAFCHVETDNPIRFRDAYGAGMVNATAAVAP